eukprot:1109570-Pelagomonas_calceolata.AAC.1
MQQRWGTAGFSCWACSSGGALPAFCAERAAAVGLAFHATTSPAMPSFQAKGDTKSPEVCLLL